MGLFGAGCGSVLRSIIALLVHLWAKAGGIDDRTRECDPRLALTTRPIGTISLARALRPGPIDAALLRRLKRAIDRHRIQNIGTSVPSCATTAIFRPLQSSPALLPQGPLARLAEQQSRSLTQAQMFGACRDVLALCR
ncbi:hypothetical protein W911_04680 [Hyphomicrobium nitrativorans NL23]|uniref:Uncharacterized protein n=1 Tax=Hyphomicrobium nitrativorans NL23 TaxID=1029756 RepID=V5SJ32_9HYPH|nr:hypothetical protein W911_04680 [Hyphomicrobium nitrativorans NL23]